MPPPDPLDGWNQRLLSETGGSDMVFTPEEIAAINADTTPPRPDPNVAAPDQRLLLGDITRAGKEIGRLLG